MAPCALLTSGCDSQVQGGRPRRRGPLRGRSGRLRGARLPRLRHLHVGCACTSSPLVRNARAVLTRVAAACAEPFEVSDDADSVQMLTRSSQIGEFYVMAPPQVEPANKAHTCDLLIYDEESDRHVRITWEDALKACCVAKLGENGELPDTATDLRSGDTSRVDPAAKLSHPTASMTGGEKDLAAWYAAAYAWVGYTKDTAAGGAAGGAAASGGGGGGYSSLDKDVRIVLARPFIEHLMHNAIMTVSGRDTGATLFGPADMQLSVSYVITRTWYSSASIPEVAANRLLLVPFAGQHPSQDDRGVRQSFEHTHTHTHTHTHSRTRARACYPVNAACQALHGPLQGGRDQAAERADHARRRVRGLRRRVQHAVLRARARRQQQEDLLARRRAPGHAGPPLLRRRRRRQVRLDARLPVHGGPARVQPGHGHGHVGDLPTAPLGGDGPLRARPLVLPGRPGRLQRVQQRARPRLGPLRRGHEGGGEPGLHLAGNVCNASGRFPFSRFPFPVFPFRNRHASVCSPVPPRSARRGPPTTPRASSARTASTTRSQSRS